MLKNTFIHIPGIGRHTERLLWKSRIFSWDDFISSHHLIPISSSKKEIIAFHVKKSLKAYEEKDYRFFAGSMPVNFHWRAYHELKEKCCFLDIETTGLDRYSTEITLIGLYDGNESCFFINGKNLGEFRKKIKEYPLIITFNGRCFDLPFIKSRFPDIEFDKFHVDLRFAMKEIGYHGGLKNIEKAVGIKRKDEIKDIDGFGAVRLWHKYKRGDREALGLLIKYNQADIENLKVLMDFAYHKLKEKEFLSVK